VERARSQHPSVSESARGSATGDPALAEAGSGPQALGLADQQPRHRGGTAREYVQILAHAQLFSRACSWCTAASPLPCERRQAQAWCCNVPSVSTTMETHVSRSVTALVL
jgi:hypothetical protein